MVAKQGCDPREEVYLSSFPLSVPVWIVGSVVTWII